MFSVFFNPFSIGGTHYRACLDIPLLSPNWVGLIRNFSFFVQCFRIEHENESYPPHRQSACPVNRPGHAYRRCGSLLRDILEVGGSCFSWLCRSSSRHEYPNGYRNVLHKEMDQQEG